MLLTLKLPGEIEALVFAEGETLVAMLHDIGFETDANPVAVHVVLVTTVAPARAVSNSEPSASRIIGIY